MSDERADRDTTLDRATGGELAVDAPGADEVAVLPWPLLLRQRITERAEHERRYQWLVLACVLFGLFTVGFTVTILSNSLRRIGRDLDADVATLTWVLTGPLLAFAVVGPAAGKLGDLRGHRRVYGLSMACVSVFAALTAVAWDGGSLIVFRILGAATGAATGPSSLAIINRLFPRERRAQAMGYWSMVGAGGPVIGVVAGGPIVQTFGWRWIFIAQVPLALAGLLAALALIPDTEPREHESFDAPGTVTLAAGATALLLAVNRGPLWGWTSPGVVIAFMLCPIALVAFVVVERRSSHPLLRLDYLRRRNFTFPLGNQFFVNFAYMGGFIITPLLLQEQFGYSEVHTGNLLIARPSTFAITGPIAGYLAWRVGERTSATVGAVAIVGSMVWLASLAPGTSDWAVAGALALSGAGLGASSPAMAATIANAVDDRDLGIAGATQQMCNQIGIVVGIQTMQTVQATRADAVGAVAAYGDAYLVGGGVALLGLIAALFVRSTRAAPIASGEAGAAADAEPEVAIP